MTAPSPVHAEARKLADHLSTIIAAADEPPTVGTVTTATTAGAIVKVTRFGKEQVAGGGYLNSYTPTVGDRVLCVVVDAQLIVLGKLIGQP